MLIALMLSIQTGAVCVCCQSEYFTKPERERERGGEGEREGGLVSVLVCLSDCVLACVIIHYSG